jgi:hypothetical protein
MSPALVEYERSGGVAGHQDRLEIKQDGRATVTKRGERRELELAPALLQRIADTLDHAKLQDLPAENPAQGQDLMTYRVTYRTRTIRAMDTAVPWPLQGVLRVLNEILDR